jgi:hypothetical protein
MFVALQAVEEAMSPFEQPSENFIAITTAVHYVDMLL